MSDKRLFFGLLPPDDVREQFVELQNRYVRRGSRHHPRDLHMTLVFIGMSDQRNCLETMASLIRLPSFGILIDQVDYWRRPKVLLAGSSATPEPLVNLVGQLETGAVPCGYSKETRPYHPHVTLARRSTSVDKQEITAICWPVTEFRLMWSRDGIGTPRYQTLATWKLDEHDQNQN